MYWGKKYIHVYNVHGFLWHENWLYFTWNLTSIEEAVQRISIIIIYIIPWNIFMGFAEHFLKFPGWRPARVVLAKKLRKRIDHIIKTYLHLLLLYFHSISVFSFLPFFWVLDLLIQHPLLFSLKLPVQFCWVSLLLWCLIHIYEGKKSYWGVMFFQFELTCNFVVALQYNLRWWVRVNLHIDCVSKALCSLTTLHFQKW